MADPTEKTIPLVGVRIGITPGNLGHYGLYGASGALMFSLSPADLVASGFDVPSPPLTPGEEVFFDADDRRFVIASPPFQSGEIEFVTIRLADAGSVHRPIVVMVSEVRRVSQKLT